MSSNPDAVIAAIDGALAAYETSPDAMRWTSEPARPASQLPASTFASGNWPGDGTAFAIDPADLTWDSATNQADSPFMRSLRSALESGEVTITGSWIEIGP